MKTLNVTVQCIAVYNSSIQVPDDMSLEEAIAYAKAHINEIPCGELEYVSDSDELDEENCDFDCSYLSSFPYVGIIYNWKGLKEENYLYTMEEIKGLDEELYKRAADEETIEMEICGWKTYTAHVLTDEESLRDFLKGERNAFPLSPESDAYKSLKEEWYWECVRNNDFYGQPSDTMNMVIDALGIKEEELAGTES